AQATGARVGGLAAVATGLASSRPLRGAIRRPRRGWLVPHGRRHRVLFLRHRGVLACIFLRARCVGLRRTTARLIRRPALAQLRLVWRAFILLSVLALFVSLGSVFTPVLLFVFAAWSILTRRGFLRS